MEYLKIENFKCFYEVEIPLNKLTIFAGANGNGKSTGIQALLFLRRTIEHCAIWVNNKYVLNEPNGLNVELNGAYCLALGNSSYVLPKKSNKDTVLLGIFNETKEVTILYNTNNGEELWLTPISITNDFNDCSPLFNQEFYYLNAERIGPRISQSIKFFDYPNAGFQGEYTAQLISQLGYSVKFEIEKHRRHPKSNNPRLEQQVNAWLNEIMPGVSISAEYNSTTHSAQIKVDNFYTKNDPAISTNIGFGISYVLPIIVTGLIAKEGSFFIVENPEAHLHPSAQSKIGRFLSVIANAGVNVIIETHSDHLLNGVQIAVALKEIDNEKICINFFDKDESSYQPVIEVISINNLGELSKWPKGFFDQTQIDYAELFKIRKG